MWQERFPVPVPSTAELEQCVRGDTGCFTADHVFSLGSSLKTWLSLIGNHRADRHKMLNTMTCYPVTVVWSYNFALWVDLWDISLLFDE